MPRLQRYLTGYIIAQSRTIQEVPAMWRDAIESHFFKPNILEPGDPLCPQVLTFDFGEAFRAFLALFR